MVGKDSKEVIDALSDATIAVSNSVLACEAVTYFSDTTSERVTEIAGVRGLAVQESAVTVGLDRSVKSEDRHTS